MAPALSLIFHGTCAVCHMYAIYWLVFLGMNILELASFFTVWTTFFHLIMNIMLGAHDVNVLFFGPRTGKVVQSGIYEISNSTKRNGFLSKEIILGLLIHLAIVMSTCTQFIFWALYLFDRDLILPETTGFPSFLNHMLHTFPLPLAVVALLVFSTNFPGAKKEAHFRIVSRVGLALACFVGIAYIALTFILFEIKGFWPYPFMFSFSRKDFLAFSLIVFLSAVAVCHVCSLLEFKVKNFKIH